MHVQHSIEICTNHYAVIMNSFKSQVQSLVGSSSWFLEEHTVIPDPADMIPDTLVLSYVIVAGWNGHVNHRARL